MSKKTKPEPKKLQDFLPGMAPVKNKKVHDLALNYAELRDERIAAGVEEKDAHETLLHTMLEEGLDIYVYGDLKVVVNASRKCKVSTEPAKPFSNDQEGE